MNIIKRLKKNTVGTDYFVGDIHGCYDLLMNRLAEIKFDTKKDRLISVGDLVDRGPDSIKCLGLLNETWFHAVMGNHEEMMYSVLNRLFPSSTYIKKWRRLVSK